MDCWKTKTLLIVTLTITGLNRVNSRLTVTPSDVEVVNGSWVTLNCSTDSTSPVVWVKDWGFFRKTVFNGSSIAAKFITSYNISRPKQGSFNLEFVATEETASVYRCEEEKFDGDSASAKLDIIKSAGPSTMPDLRSRFHGFNRDYQPHDPHHGPPYVPNERSLQNIAERYNNHGRDTEPKTGPDNTALIAGILGTIMVLATVVKCCCCCCCR